MTPPTPATTTPTTPATPAPVTTPTPGTAVARRVAWLAGALFWSAFAVLEAVHHGWAAATLALVFFIAPDLTFLVAVRDAPRMAPGQLPPRAVPYYNAAHRALIPLVLVLAYTLVPFTWAPAFAALCGWLAHISYDRAFGYGLRTEEGFQRG
ncbi:MULTISPECIES: DUF4260 family protein [unclassified Streptomyces]|uniref:DUF4260 family protein n=1 Tax=unclassified Streptomyces TaxID=2593676 RepID=UPI003D71BA86